jgi:organic radical activating enzyme
MVDNFYCSQKFTWLSVDLEKRLMYSCCAAVPEKIDLDWLKKNSGDLFSSVKIQQERQDMLSNIPVDSCKKACWDPESQGLESRRLQHNSYNRTHADIKINVPEKLNIILGSTCNLTCSYCCKQYSTAWTRDVQTHGTYFDDPRFNLVAIDSILSRISQSEHQYSEGAQIIINELTKYKNLKEIIITGGEPFLYNNFPDLINAFDNCNNLFFYTGLGVDSKRLINQLERIVHKKNITAYVSAETCDQLYEFNRHGNTYQTFVNNLEILQTNFKVRFSSVLSNLTIHGIVDFVNQHPDKEFAYNFCNDPAYLGINVMDDHTKDKLIESISSSNIVLKDSIISTMTKSCSELQRQQFSSYICQFAQRRNLKLDIFPATMLKWLNLM